MQRIMFRADDERTEPGGGSDSAAAVTASRHVTLVFPATRAEYEQARAGGEPVVRHGDETLPGHVSAGPTEGSAHVATTDTQRRAWSLPDLTCAGREDDGAAVAVMAPCDAIRTLLGGDARDGPPARRPGPRLPAASRRFNRWRPAVQLRDHPPSPLITMRSPSRNEVTVPIGLRTPSSPGIWDRNQRRIDTDHDSRDLLAAAVAHQVEGRRSAVRRRRLRAPEAPDRHGVESMVRMPRSMPDPLTAERAPSRAGDAKGTVRWTEDEVAKWIGTHERGGSPPATPRS